MKKVLAAALLTVALVAQAFAGGTPHQVLGKATYANNTVPLGSPEMRFEAHVTTRPAEVLTENDVGCGIQFVDPECWWWVECGNFPTPWSDGEPLRIDFWGDGANNPPTFRPESAYVIVILDESVGSQDVGEIEIPVELGQFTAQGGEEEVVLTWSTASETNNLGFFLYRASASTGPWTKINEELIPGAGSSASPHQYSYRDRDLAPGEYWYQVEDVSSFGDADRHGPVSAVAEPLSYLSLTSAHVVGDDLRLSFSVPRTGQVTAKMYNTMGREARVLVDEPLQAGRHQMDCGIDGVASGLYFCRLRQEGSGEVSFKVSVVR
jgi:hypothetical protein